MSKHLRVIALLWITLMAFRAAAAEYTVYFNNDKGWSQVYTWIWDKNDGDRNYTGGKWPGTVMQQDTEHPDLYKYTFTCDNSNPKLMCIFNQGDDNGKTGDLDFKDAYVYNSQGAVKPVSQWESSTTVECVEWIIYFNNNVSWNSVNLSISGNPYSTGGAMMSYLNSSIYEIKFQALKNASITGVFSGNSESSNTFTLVNGHIYTKSRDCGPRENYNPADELPEAEWWYEPANPTQNDEITLYFNKNYDSNSKLKNTADIYLWTGAVVEKDSWKGAPTTWKNFGDDATANKYKMTADPDHDGLYTYKYSPNLTQWAGLDADARPDQIGIIFRDKSGDTKQHGNDNQYITLRRLPQPAAGLGAYQSLSSSTADGLSTIEITAERGKLFLTPMSAEVIKVFTQKNGNSGTPRASISVLDPSSAEYKLPKPGDVSTSEDNAFIYLNVDGTDRLKVSKSNTLITFLNEDGSEGLTELNGLVNSNGSVNVTFQPMNDAGFYGGGYNGKVINQDGQTLEMNNTQTGGWSQDYKNPPHNICIPYFISTEGYGIYFDDHTRNAKVMPSAVNGTEFSSSSITPIAYYYIGGGEMQRVMENYTLLTGTPELPPYWTMGYIASKFSYYSRSEAESVITKIKNDCSLPMDGIVFDIHWQGGPNKMGKIDWDTSNYPNPSEMMSNFRNNYGVRTICITEPFFTGNSGNYKTEYFADSHTSNMGWLGNGDNVGLLDVTKNSAREWFKGLYKARTREGVDSWWLDLGEPEQHDSDATYSDGSSVNQIHNEYGNRWLSLTYEAMKEMETEGTPVRRLLMPRAGTAGMQRYNAAPWTGDIQRSWNGLAAQVPALVSAAMSGVSTLGSDIGGFTAPNNYNDNVYLRWVQLGVFYPMMRTHAAHSDNRQEPDPFNHMSVIGGVRDAINLRYAYLPYLYTQSFAYSAYGTPMGRPANFADRDKARLNNVIDAYYWGPDVYVAPMLWEGTSRSISLPEGNWLDMTDFTTVYNGSIGNYSVPYSKLPRFMREGSSVVRYRENTFTNTDNIRRDKITVDCFPAETDTPDDSAVSSWYDDDHKDVYAIRDRKFILTRFLTYKTIQGNSHFTNLHINRAGHGWNGMNETQDMLIRIRNYTYSGDNLDVVVNDLGPAASASYAPGRVAAEPRHLSSLSADLIAQAESLTDTETEGYYLDRAAKTLYLRIPAMNTTHNYILAAANITLTAVDEITAETLSLTYSDGYFTYSAPAATEDLKLQVYTLTGICAAEFAGLDTDGAAAQIETDLPAGVYIARLSGRDSRGNSAQRTLKVCVR